MLYVFAIILFSGGEKNQIYGCHSGRTRYQKRFGRDYETVHSTGATITIVILFVQIYYFFAVNVSHTKNIYVI